MTAKVGMRGHPPTVTQTHNPPKITGNTVTGGSRGIEIGGRPDWREIEGKIADYLRSHGMPPAQFSGELWIALVPTEMLDGNTLGVVDAEDGGTPTLFNITELAKALAE